jgi:hypothetical protein
MKTFLVFFSFGGKIPVLELELLRTFCIRTRKVYTQVEILILTDPATGSVLRKAGLRTLDAEVRPETLLLDRTRMFHDYVAAQPPGNLVCLVDHDIIINRPLSFVEAGSFDVAYTFRKRAQKYPLNGGIVVARTGAASASFIHNVLENYQRLPADQLAWWGDQIGVWNLVRPYLDNLREGVIEIDQVRLLLVDGETFNWTPFDMDVSKGTLRANFFLSEALYRQCREKAVVHFKGPRKHLQIQYFDRLAVDQLELPSDPLTQDHQKDPPQRQFCSLRMERFDRWHVSQPGQSGGVAIADLTFEQAIREVQNYGCVEIDLRVMVKGDLPPSGRDKAEPICQRWVGIIAEFSANPLEDRELKLLSAYEPFAALLAGAMPIFACASGSEIADIAGGIEGHLTLFGMLVALAARGDIQWTVSDRSSPVTPKKFSTQDLCAALLVSRSRHAKSILLRILLGDALGESLAHYSTKSVLRDDSRQLHPGFDECDWAVFACLYKKVASEVGFAANSEYFEADPLATITRYRDFRGGVLGG